MSIEYIIPIVSLKFCRPAVPKKDVRAHLHCVHVLGTVAEATDGRMLLRRRDKAQIAPEPLSIPTAAVDWAIKAARGQGKPDSVKILREDDRLTLRVGAQSFTCESMDGKFPNCDRVVPADPASAPAGIIGFAPDLLVALSKAAEALPCKACVRIYPRGEAAAVVDFPLYVDRPEGAAENGEVAGVVMPIRRTAGIPSVIRTDGAES